jgi:hypothetical protein
MIIVKLINLLFISTLLMPLPGAAHSKESKLRTFIIEVKQGGNRPHLIEFPNKPKNHADTVIWTSESGIKCTFGPWGEKDMATLECKGPGNYKVQATYSCAANEDKENAGYLWVGQEDIIGGHRSFKIYCKE